MKCKNCNAETGIEMKFCPNCGQKDEYTANNKQHVLQTNHQKRNKGLFITICVLLVVIMSGMVFIYYQINQNKQLEGANSDLLDSNDYLQSELSDVRIELDNVNKQMNNSRKFLNNIAPLGFFVKVSSVINADYGGNLISTDLIANEIRFLRVNFEVKSTNISKTFNELQISLYGPDGKLIRSDDSVSKNYSNVRSYNIDTSQNYGIGNDTVSNFKPGYYTYKFYIDGQFLNEYSFEIE